MRWSKVVLDLSQYSWQAYGWESHRLNTFSQTHTWFEEHFPSLFLSLPFTPTCQLSLSLSLYLTVSLPTKHILSFVNHEAAKNSHAQANTCIMHDSWMLLTHTQTPGPRNLSAPQSRWQIHARQRGQATTVPVSSGVVWLRHHSCDHLLPEHLIFKYSNKNGTNAWEKKLPFRHALYMCTTQSPSFKPTPPNFHYSLTALPFTPPWLSFSFLLCLGCQFPFLSGWLVLNERWVINGGTQGLQSPLRFFLSHPTRTN